MEERHLLLPPRCLAEDCDQAFEDQLPKDWVGADIALVATLYDSARQPEKRLAMRVSTFFCPNHAAKIAQIKDLGDFVEASLERSFTVRLDDG